MDEPEVLFNCLHSGEAEGDEGCPRAAKRPIDYFSVPSHGHLILTTRYKRVASKFIDGGDGGVSIEVGATEEAQAVTLLRKRVNKHSREDLQDIASELGYVPLALVQAAAYIQQKPCSARHYLDMLRKSDISKNAILNSCADSEITRENLILSTWQITFDHIRRIRPSAADRLSVMSFFDHRSIPECLLAIEGASECTRSAGEVQNDLAGDLQTLHSFDLVSSKPQGKVFEMHPLVSFAVKSWLNASGHSEHWHERSLSNICSALPANGGFQHWPQWQILYPHMQLVMQSRAESREAKLDKASILNGAANYLSQQGLYNTAETLRRESLSIRASLLGEEDLDTLDTEFELGRLLMYSGQYDAAEETWQMVWRKYRTVYGEEHINTLVALSKLMKALRNTGKCTTAEDLGHPALRVCDEAFGRGHWLRVRLSVEMINVLRHLKKHKKVDELNARLLQEFAKLSHKGQHPHMVWGAVDFADSLYAQNRVEDAVSMYRWALASQQSSLGDEHPDTLYTVYALAFAMRRHGGLKEADDLMRQALNGNEKVLGTNNKWTLLSMHELAKICKDLGQYQEALRLADSCLERSMKLLGADHPLTTSRRELRDDLARTTESFSGTGVSSRMFDDSRNSKGLNTSEESDQAEGGSSDNDTPRSKRHRRPPNAEGIKSKKPSRKSHDQCIVQ